MDMGGRGRRRGKGGQDPVWGETGRSTEYQKCEQSYVPGVDGELRVATRMFQMTGNQETLRNQDSCH